MFINHNLPQVSTRSSCNSIDLISVSEDSTIKFPNKGLVIEQVAVFK